MVQNKSAILGLLVKMLSSVMVFYVLKLQTDNVSHRSEVQHAL